MVTNANRSAIPKPVYRLARSVLAKIALRGNVTHGRNLRVGRGALVGAPHRLDISDDVAIGMNSIIQVNGSIGRFALIGANVQIVGRNDHAYDELGTPMAKSTWVADRPATEKDAVHIGPDVWIGASSVVLSGVSIGAGAIVGAGSVVTKDVSAFSIVGGNPARELGKRFNDETERAEHLRAPCFSGGESYRLGYK